MTAPMRPLQLRRLTPAEGALAAEMFGAGLAPERVFVFALPLWSRAFVAGPRLIVWPAAWALTDFGDPAVPLGVQAIFVHELTHVWQAQNGVNLLVAKLRCGDSAKAYAYDLLQETPFGRLNIEQQAMVVQHAFTASRGGETPFPGVLYARAASGWRQA